MQFIDQAEIGVIVNNSGDSVARWRKKYVPKVYTYSIKKWDQRSSVPLNLI